MNNEFDEKSKENSESPEGEENYVYKKVIKNKQNRRTWSVASIILAVLSVVLVYFSHVSLCLGLASVGCAFMSRKNLGYFDKISLAGMIIAIFGVVFSIAGIIFTNLFSGIIF